MAKFRVHKTSFTAGEVSPWLFGRGDLRAYENGARRLRNVFIHPTGGVYRRPGLRFVDLTPGNGRLLAFEFNTQQVYLIAFFDGVLFIYQDDVKIAQLQTPWYSSHVGQLNWTQSADTLLVVHPDTPPKKITRSANGKWELSDWTYFVKDGRISCPHYKFARDNVTLTPSAQMGEITLKASDAVFDQNHIGTCFRLADREVLITDVLSPSDANAQVNDTLVDVEPTEDWTEQAFSAVRGWPTSVCFHQDRLVIGGSRDLPNNLWLSKSADLFNFEVGEGLDDEAISFSILSDQVNAIRHVFSGRHLQVFTSGAEWMVSGDPLTPMSIQLFRQTRIGSPIDRTVPPKDVDGATLFVPRNGPQLREFLFTDVEQAYQATDLAMLAHHLIDRPVAIEFDQSSRLFHIVMDDGSLATLTIYRDEQVTAWTRQETKGTFLSITNVGGQTYVLVLRKNGFSIEKFDSSISTDSALTGSNTMPTDEWSGMFHLEAENVIAIADDATFEEVRVEAGRVTLDEPAHSVQVGLSFAHVIEPLAPPVISGAASRGKRMRPISFRFRLKDTRMLHVDTGRGLHPVSLRRFGNAKLDQNVKNLSGDVTITASGWRALGQDPLWRIEQDTPFPFTLLSVSSEISVNG